MPAFPCRTGARLDACARRLIAVSARWVGVATRALMTMAIAAPSVSAQPAQDAGTAAEGSRVVLVTIDGVRWQDLFRGADPAIVADPKQTEGAADIRRRFVDVADRGAALAPFLHGVVAAGGVLIGDRDHGSCMTVGNAYWFSYPGYNELLTGHADPRVNSNDPTDNPNVSVLEWLNDRPGFAGRVQALGTWATFHQILNVPRSRLPVNAGVEPMAGEGADVRAANRIQQDMTPLWATDERFDAITHAYARHVQTAKTPRVLYVAYGEPDAWAHEGSYDKYLLAVANADRFIGELWRAAQADPASRGRTTLIVTTDHGRGAETAGVNGWRNHGSGRDEHGVAHADAKHLGSDQTWAAVLGPRPLQAAAPSGCATSGAVAATVLDGLGLDWRRYDATIPAPLVVARPGAH
jgi:hypothetical protein